MKWTFFVLLIVFHLCACDKQVLRLTGDNKAIHSALQFIERNEVELDLDLWRATKDTIDISVHKELTNIFHELAKLKSLDCTILMDSLDAELEEFNRKHLASVPIFYFNNLLELMCIYY